MRMMMNSKRLSIWDKAFSDKNITTVKSTFWVYGRKEHMLRFIAAIEERTGMQYHITPGNDEWCIAKLFNTNKKNPYFQINSIMFVNKAYIERFRIDNPIFYLPRKTKEIFEMFNLEDVPLLIPETDGKN